MERVILRTLCYHDIFDYPLTADELYRFKIVNSKLKTQNAKLQRKAKNLIEEGKIEEKDNFYFLNGREEIVGIRKRRERCSRKKLLIAERVVKWLRLIPTIKMIGVTGAVGIGNARKNDDIDFLIITSSGRLWLTRILAVLFIEVLGRRRRPAEKKVTDKICLNIFLDESYLQMPKGKQNLFVAHEIVQMKIVFEKDETDEKFLAANQWVRNFLANGIKTQNSNLRPELRSRELKTQNYLSALSSRSKDNLKIKAKDIFYSLFVIPLHLLERLAYWWQLRYMQSKRTTEQVNLHFAFFHPTDVGERVIREYRKKISNI